MSLVDALLAAAGQNAQLGRLISAVERIANALEDTQGEGLTVRAPIVLKLDGKTVGQQVMRYTLSRADRGPSSLVGGELGKERDEDGSNP